MPSLTAAMADDFENRSDDEHSVVYYELANTCMFIKSNRGRY
jgi:hypothetical protein